MHTSYAGVKPQVAAAGAPQGPSTLGSMYRRTLPLLVATALLAACMQEGEDPLEAGTTSTTEDEAEPPSDDGELSPDPIEWDDCGGVECATMEVPLDYEHPDGDQIELYMARTPASGERIGALFVNPGGPGAGGAEYAELLPYVLPEEVTEHFDIVGIDPRGVGGSTPIDCGTSAKELYAADASIDSPEDEEALLEISAAYVDDCGEKYGDLLAHVGTRDVARDMDVVRAAMGDEQLSYLGVSYYAQGAFKETAEALFVLAFPASPFCDTVSRTMRK